MRFTIMAFLTISILTSGCKVTIKKYEAPKTKPVKLDLSTIKPSGEIAKDLLTCDELQRKIAPDLERNAISIRGTTDKQDVEFVNCEGEKRLLPKFERYNFTQELTIEPPFDIKGSVAYANVKNTRTCVERKVSAKEYRRFHSIHSTGSIILRLTDAFWRSAEDFNVRNGQNLIEVVYFNETDQEVGRQMVLVNVEIETRELNGVRHLNICRRTMAH